MPRASTRIPKHCLHRRSGRGYVTLNGKQIPTGRYGTPEAEDAYSRILAEWLSGGQQAPPAPGGSHETTISDLVARYWRFAEKKYSVAGRPTGELANVRYALSYLLRSNGLLPAAEFGPLRLKRFQSRLAESGLCRTTVNKIVGHTRRMIRWAVSEELVAPDAYYALSAVENFRKGDGHVREPEPVGEASESHVRAVLPLVTPPIRAMILIQWYTGMRPGEVRNMRGRDLDIAKEEWTYRPREHKSAHKGKSRAIPIGPRARKVLEPFLKDDPDAAIFSPAEAVAHSREIRRTRRKTRVQPSQIRRAARAKANPRQRLGDVYSAGSYGRAVTRACKQAGVPVWSPNQLRHSAATRIRAEFGAEAAQHCLGHSHMRTTEIYAERDEALARKVMEALG